MGGKWLELLKEIAPRVTRAAVLRDPAISQGIGQFGAIQSVARSLGVEVSLVNIRDAGEIERDVAAFARGPNSGLIVTGSGVAIVHRKLIVTLAAKHKLPGVYFQRNFVADGGLISYGPDPIDPVCTENLNPDVMVMKSAEDRMRLDIPDPLNGTKGRCIFVQ
jgi:putative ABC transport system substrate-binding protein